MYRIVYVDSKAVEYKARNSRVKRHFEEIYSKYYSSRKDL